MMLNETINILNDLNLYGLKNSISNEIDYITNNNLSFLEGLNHFLKSEVKYREINRAEANIKVAHFPYLKEMLINVDETNVLSVYGGGLHRVIYQMSANLSSLIPIIEIAQENPAYQIEKPGSNHNFLNTLLKDLGSHAYNSNHEETSEKIRILSEYVPNLKEVYSAALINDKDGANQAQ